LTGQNSAVISDDVERLLSGRTRDIRLSPALMDAFRERSFKQTSKIIRAWMVWVVLLDVLAMVSNLILLPTTEAMAMLGPALLIPPAAALVFWAWSRDAITVALDAYLVAGMFVILLAVALMGFAAGGEFQERYVSVMLFVAVTAVIIFNVASWATLLMAGMGLAIYLSFQLANPNVSTASAISGFLFFASGVASTVVARRTMSILAHRTFLLELRDARRVAELANANAKLEQLSRTDPLTGLSNRRYMEAISAELFAAEPSKRGPLAFLMCDIDCFKALNDRQGHLEGDRALVQVASIIARSVDPERDYVSRFGGEEFLVLLTNVTPVQAVARAELIRRKVKEAGLINPGSSAADVVTLSIGVAAESDHSGTTATELQHAADIALYSAKRRGRNRVERAIGGSNSVELAG